MPNTRGTFLSTVVANQPLCDEHWRLTLRVHNFPPTAPGQFIQLACGPEADDQSDPDFTWPEARSFQPRPELKDRTAILRRPFSLAGRRDLQSAAADLDIIHRVVGAGTAFLADRNIGDPLSLLGPLGNRFPIPPKDSVALLIGGGVGIPPMLYLAESLANQPAIAFAGALRQSLLPLTLNEPPTADPTQPRPCVAEFARHNIPTIIATDDGSAGYRGFVTQALEAYLDAHPHQPHILFTCGPEPMMKRVATIAAQRNLPCHIAVERAMACGMGTCQSCCIKVKKKDPAAVPMPGQPWAWRLACTDGPIFDADSLLW